MYTKAYITFLFAALGMAAPIFPVPRPYIPSGLGPVPASITQGYTMSVGEKILSRALVDTEGEPFTGPILGEWKHTHGPMLPTPMEEERSLIGCDEGIACGGVGENVDGIKDKLEELFDELKEEAKEAKDKVEEVIDDKKKTVAERILADLAVEERILVEKDLGDCKEYMWGC